MHLDTSLIGATTIAILSMTSVESAGIKNIFEGKAKEEGECISHTSWCNAMPI
jgi:hypothetical protein